MRCLSSVAVAILCALPVLAADDIDPERHAFVATQDPLNEPVTKIVYLSQNWSPAESTRFYFTAQGSQLIPYDWFLALEQADTTTPFRDNQNILKYRYLAQNPGPLNADGLPVGFVKDSGVGREWLGITCAACHTAEIRLGNTGYRIDGAPAQGDIQGLLTALIGAMQATQNASAKFGRFAAKILANHNTPANQARLKAQLAASIKTRVGYNLRNFPDYDPALTISPAPTRYARLDAVDAIINEVYHHSVKNPNPNKPTEGAQAANAPVSYPFLWDTPQHDNVEWLGIAKSGGPAGIFSLARNVGEVIGVFGDLEIPDDPSILSLGYASSVNLTALEELEDLLETLWSPQWPDDFPKIDQTAATQGAALYQTNCKKCHAVIDRTDPDRAVEAVMRDSKTDPQASINFFTRTGDSGKLNGVPVNFIPFTPKIPQVADANVMLSNLVIGTILGRLKQPPPDELNQINFQGSHMADTVLAVLASGAQYKARPLNGIWATAPYLHNGSVPNLDALLQPTAHRPTSFSIGVRTFDPVGVGYLTNAPGFPRFNVSKSDGTPIVGNSNAGHEYGTNLTDDERRQLIEYLKTL